MNWVWWLLAPFAATVLAAVSTWLHNRPPKSLTAEQSMRAHRTFLAALADRPAHPPPANGPPRS